MSYVQVIKNGTPRATFYYDVEPKLSKRRIYYEQNVLLSM
jgi:hypothetical protein